ncbi:MAG: Na/Pi cotransporter family protein [Clostridia bacterium]|nr:Na/Pi cotransporter family protein [Clostridia bacterium]
MDVFSVFALLGGLALFLFGMNLMGSGLEKISGGKLERVLEKMTDKPLKGVLLGAVVTAVIQSSSAVTVMVVGFVNSGIMQLSQAVGIIMGANIGTTATSWILSLTGIESSNAIVSLFKPTTFSPLVAFIGIIFIFLDKNGKKKDIGSILIGFAILMYGMTAMSDAVQPLSENEAFANILLMFSNPVLGVLAGAVFTAIIQSSSASIGILQALSSTGAITVGSAIPILLGQNIGTCVTALISSIGTSKNAKRTAMVHFYFNVIGTVLFLVLYYTLDLFIDFAFKSDVLDAVGIAVIHTLFNVLSTALLLPFSKQLEKLAKLSVKESAAKDEFPALDERFLLSPSYAVAQSYNVSVSMFELCKEMLFDALNMLEKYDLKVAEKIRQNEDLSDRYEDRLGTYLVNLASHDLTETDSNTVSGMLHAIGDMERIGDHALNILELAEEINKKQIVFSEDAEAELSKMSAALREIMNLTYDSYKEYDPDIACHVEPLEQVVDLLKDILKTNHIQRLRKGECTIEQGFIFTDISTNLSRISDHCSNIAVGIIRSKNSDFDTHSYLNSVKYSTRGQFVEDFKSYKEKYNL